MAIALCITGSSLGAQAQTRNSIAQDTALYPFFAALHQADSNVVRVLHLGDSHVQAGYFPVAAAAALQQRFGNAGRGWVFPYNVAGTNGPGDYRFNSSTRWQAARIVDKHKTAMLGPGAIAITTTAAAPALAFTGRQEEGVDNNVRTATLFYDAGEQECTVNAPGADVTVTPAPFFAGSTGMRQATLQFPATVQAFQARWEGKGQGPFRFYGALLQNGHNGVLYNAIGINGAMYQHYNEMNSTLAAQMELLQPQLVIISLGTNEAYGSLNAEQLLREIDSTVQLLRRMQPQAAILLTTPPDCKRVSRKAYRKKVGKKYRTYYRISYYPNPNITAVTQQLLGYCRQNGLACWNFNALNRSMAGAFAGGWAPDHIHFNAKGYRLQGQLLYQALLQSYNRYVAASSAAAVITEQQTDALKQRPDTLH